MKKCSFGECEEELPPMPSKCKLCNQFFCAKHRLAEQHDCARIDYYKTDEYRKSKMSQFQPKIEIKEKKKKEKGGCYYSPRDLEQTNELLRPKDRFLTRSSLFTLFAFNKNLYNILVVTLFISMILCLNALIWNRPINNRTLLTFLYIFGGVHIIYGGHEIVQIIVARRYSLKPKTVIWIQGLLISLLGLIIPAMIIPSHLGFEGQQYRYREKAIVSISGVTWLMGGAITSMILSLGKFGPVELLNAMNIFPIFIFSFLLFRLIFFGIGSGQYISVWNKKVSWSLIATNLILLLIYIILDGVL